MTIDARDNEELRVEITARLEELLDDPATDDIDILGAVATAVAETQELVEVRLANVADQAYLTTASGEELTLKAQERGVKRREAVRATGWVRFSREDPATTDYVIAEGTRVQTDDGDVEFRTREPATLEENETSVDVDVRATDGGTEGNLPPNKLVRMPSPPTGVEAVTNPDPTGEPSLEDTNGRSLVAGEDRETDAELRERTFDSLSLGGAATVMAIRSALRELDGTRSIQFFINSEPEEDENGLPPYSTEVLVSGGERTEVAETLAESVSVIDLFRLEGGVNGDGVAEEIFIEAIEQDVVVDFSRPLDVDVTIDVDVVTGDDYIGDEDLKDRIVEHIGGTRTDGSVATGLEVGEDIFINQLESRIVGAETGVDGISELTIDSDGDGTDDRTTNEDGLDVIDIAKAEQATVHADAITVTEV